ncbi:MAG: hypothetical protein HOD92_00780 [Deltaproteobacteria bacterium]|jgi:NAD-dependent DNA ligase|nr:hypothetical protein [Deltaproteobacteria bacterium]MBT4525880.1 hypothetical protein [Deltaproteobacteria bacterium]
MSEFNGSFLFSTGPQELDLAIHTLEGLIKGIAIDSEINEKELKTVNSWISDHIHLKNRHPFNELIPRLSEVIEDRIIDKHEKSDIMWLCKKFETDNVYYNKITSDLQRLQGIVGGIVADGVVLKEELENLKEWLDDHHCLKTCWPYDEIVSIIVEVLKDGKIDADEHKMLLAFFDEFVSYPGYEPVSELSCKDKKNYQLTGICASNPEIILEKKLFCFAGKISKSKKKKLSETIVKCGGEYSDEVNQSTAYLIIGDGNNPAWVFACYGRKVEIAIEMRKKRQEMLSNGEKTSMEIQIIHEADFWNAVK